MQLIADVLGRDLLILRHHLPCQGTLDLHQVQPESWRNIKPHGSDHLQKHAVAEAQLGLMSSAMSKSTTLQMEMQAIAVALLQQQSAVRGLIASFM